MRAKSIRVFAGVALALAALANSASAQTGSSILNALDVQKLVASTEAADDARLSDHFAALADCYMREATRHNAMAQAFIAAPTRRMPTNPTVNEPSSMAQAYRGTRIAQAAVHCDRLVSLSRGEAKEATKAAAMHKQLARVAR